MDETQPLLRSPENYLAEQEDNDPGRSLVDFDPKGDDENPLEWPPAYKWGIVALLAFMAFTV